MEAPFRAIEERDSRTGGQALIRNHGGRSASSVPASGNGAQQRKGRRAALQAAASRSLRITRAEPPVPPSTGSNADVRPKTPSESDSRGHRRNSRCVSSSLSAASPPSSSPGNSFSPSSEAPPAAQKFCIWPDACQPDKGRSIANSDSASHIQRQAGHDLPIRCGRFDDMTISAKGNVRSMRLVDRMRLSHSRSTATIDKMSLNAIYRIPDDPRFHSSKRSHVSGVLRIKQSGFC
jgi:hypothetical protein